MKRIAFVLAAVALYACGPSKAELAMQRCRSDFSARNWTASAISCREANQLKPSREAAHMFTQALYEKNMADFDAHAKASRDEAIANALSRQADAAERQARAAEDEEFRRRLRDRRAFEEEVFGRQPEKH